MVVVDGPVDLAGVELRCPVEFDTCRFDGDDPIGLSMATVPNLVVRDCKLPGVSGQLLTVKKGMDLSGSTISSVLVLHDADITGGLTCESTRIEGVDEENFSFHGRGLKAAGGVRLSGLSCEGAVDLGDADITGPLSFRGAEVRGPGKHSGDALYAAGIRVSSGAYLDDLDACGRVNLLDAQITGQLSLRAATIKSKQMESFAGDRMSVTGGVWLDKWSGGLSSSSPDRPFKASGLVRMSGATIGGQLSFRGAKINESGTAGCAVWADHIKVAAGATFTGAKTVGAVVLSGADITGWVNLDAADVDGNSSDGIAVLASGIRVTGGISLTSITAKGAVILDDAAIGADVSFRDAEVLATSSGSNRKIADAVSAGRNAFLPKDAVTPGGVVLTGAQIGGALRFIRAKITSVDVAGVAVMAASLKAACGLWLGKPLDEGTVAEGEFDLTLDGAVVLTDASVTGQLGVRGAQLTGLDTHGRTLAAERLTVTGDALFTKFTSAGAMVLAGAQISGELAWLPGGPVSWPLNLDGVTTNRLNDDGHWPGPGKLKLNGFKYNAFSGDHSSTLNDRLKWIQSQYSVGQETRGVPIPSRRRIQPTADSTSFSPQPYQQLASVYQASGQDDEARQVNIAANADRRRWGALKPGAWWANAVFDVTIKFGYKAWRAVVGLAAVYALAVIAFTFAQHQHDLIIPTGSTTGVHPTPTSSQCSQGYQCFYPAGFAIDIVVPIVNVHQADEWAINGDASWGWIWVGGTWVATGLGWALATLFVAGYTGLVRSN
jgi:hypothetical protein